MSKDSIESHQKFTEKLNLTFPLVSDPDGALTNLYSSGRIAYLIDKEGVVRMIVKGMPKNDEILKKLRSLKTQPLPVESR